MLPGCCDLRLAERRGRRASPQQAVRCRHMCHGRAKEREREREREPSTRTRTSGGARSRGSRRLVRRSACCADTLHIGPERTLELVSLVASRTETSKYLYRTRIRALECILGRVRKVPSHLVCCISASERICGRHRSGVVRQPGTPPRRQQPPTSRSRATPSTWSSSPWTELTSSQGAAYPS